MLEQIAQDVRFGLRTLVKNPAVSIIAALSLALATGATTAIFSLVYNVVLRPLPFAEPSELVQIAETSMVREDLESLRQRSLAFQSFSEYSPGTRNLQTQSGAERVTTVTADRYLFDVLGAAPIAGRTFRHDDALVAVISELLWRTRFGRDRNVVGRSVTLDDQTFTVVGVMPESFQFPYGAASVLRGAASEARVDVWIAEYRPLRARLSRLIARLRPRATAEAAAAEITAVELRRRSSTSEPSRIESAHVVPYTDAVLGPTRRSLWLVFGAVALVLVAACANVANLLLALASSRSQEIATRAALGASRSRLVRQFLIESLLLSVAGAVAGIFVARWTSTLLVAFGAQRIPRMHEVVFDWSVFVFLLLVCAATAIFFGIAPALAAARVDPGAIAKDAGRSTAARGYGRVRNALVVAEVALSFVLACGAALVFAEMNRLRESQNGMNTENVVTFHLGQQTAQGIEKQYYDIAERVARLPDVHAAGFTQVLPLQNWGWNSSSRDFTVKGAPARNEQPFAIELRYVTPGYFEALGIRVLQGRGIDIIDTTSSPRVILVNHTLARMSFGGVDPVGVETNRGRIVGMVEDVRQVDLDRPPSPEMYFPIAQNWSQLADLGMTLVVRVSGDRPGLIDAVRTQIRDVNPRIAIFNIRTMEQVVTDSLWNLNLYRWLMGWFAGLTLLLAAVGLYGVVSHSVTARRREWAVRLALGSTQAQVARIVLARGVALAAIGIAIGVSLLTIALGWFGSDLPFIDGSVRAVTIAAVAASIFVIALAASWLPATRVARIAPAAALRSE